MKLLTRFSRTVRPLSPAAFCAAILLLPASSSVAATLNVTSYGATGNGSTDDTAAINSAITASASGDTLLFPAGTYKITSGITFKSGRNYTGQGNAILNQATANKFCVSTEYDNGSNVLITGLTFQNGGVSFSGSGNVPANNIDIKGCTFLNITNPTYPYNEAIYIPIGASNCDFVGNTFNNIMGDNGIISWNTQSCTITDNFFNGVNEGAHLNGSSNANVTIARNTGINMHRMGIELQGSGYQNLLVEDNHFSHWVSPYYDSFGLSIVQGNQGTNSVTNQYNTLLGCPLPPPDALAMPLKSAPMKFAKITSPRVTFGTALSWAAAMSRSGTMSSAAPQAMACNPPPFPLSPAGIPQRRRSPAIHRQIPPVFSKTLLRSRRVS